MWPSRGGQERRGATFHALRGSSGRVPRWCALLLGLACAVGPKYEKPTVSTPPAYKEASSREIPGTTWVAAQPSDAVLRGHWWEMFQDPVLNGLEERVDLSNQNIAASMAAFAEARAVVKQARAQYFPTVTTSPGVTVSHTPVVPGVPAQSGSVTDYAFPFDASWAPDLWGRIRNTVRGNVAAAQASAADLENARLTAHAEVAVDYYQLRTQDALKQVLDSTVSAYRESLKLTQALYETGIDSEEAVAQAETQLDTAEASATNVGILRAQYEHAIALLIGEPASSFSLSPAPWTAEPPLIPAGLPSQLLERRPDIAASERLVAQANAQIGIATAAYFPSLTLTGSVGVESTSLASLFTWPSRVWSVGAELAETLFDAGLRRATVQQFEASYEQAVATYRQTVLTAFQQVEDNLSTLRILSQQIGQQDTAVKASQHYLTLATDRYKLGLDPYLNVITAQTALLGNEQTLANLRMQQMTASVGLIEALGGGWQASQLPSPAEMLGQERGRQAGASSG